MVAPAAGAETLSASGAPLQVAAAGPSISVPVADAFAALLEAEQQGAALPSAPGEVTMPAVPFGAPVVTDALVDAVVERLVQRLGGSALQDTVARLVSEAAERLVRAEIERLKAAAKS
jgi:poly(A) polymerase Pap1